MHDERLVRNRISQPLLGVPGAPERADRNLGPIGLCLEYTGLSEVGFIVTDDRPGVRANLLGQYLEKVESIAQVHAGCRVCQARFPIPEKVHSRLELRIRNRL